MVRPLILRLWLVLATVGVASPAFSCAVCGFGREGSASTYLMTALLMSAIPLLIIGALVYYLFQQERHSQPSSLQRDDRSAVSGSQAAPSRSASC